MEFKHIPVMLSECMNALKLKGGGIYFDGTLGGGGHTGEILRLTSPNGKVIATDLDVEAINSATDRLKNYGDRLTVVKSNYKNFDSVLDGLNISQIDGAILDLGISSYQIDNRERGFSYMGDAKLDMRMDVDSPFSAYDVINGYSEDKLKYILWTYGEEKFASTIAKNIVLARKDKPIETTSELVKICDKSIPNKFKDGHSAKKTFQAVRIEVNEELDGLDKCLYSIANRLNKGGRFAVITFHSLEDRIVKRVFKDLETDCICDKRYPCVCGRKKQAIEITKKPIIATEKECELNSRSKCAKLRVIEKL